jgi:aerobic carbon-monoxide dehydrogenase large subunit
MPPIRFAGSPDVNAYIGADITRTEDRRLLTGRGRYVDDITLPGMLHAAFVRSYHAHALVHAIDVEAARDWPGVHAVLRLEDLGEPFSHKPMIQPYPSPALKQDITSYPLARDEVCFVGQAIAVVIADSRSIAEDAAEMVEVEYEPLDVIVDCLQALDPDAPVAHVGSTDNIVASLGVGFGDIDEAFAQAPHTMFERFRQHRGGAHSMECRGVIADYDLNDDQLTIYSSTQSPYLVRLVVAEYLEEDDNHIRVIAPDVGGGFGPKAAVFPEECVLPLAARQLGRPVKWIEDRLENFTTTNQQGDQIWSLEVAANEDGTIRGVRGHVTCDNGAYTNYGVVLALTSLFPLPGPYDIDALDVKLDVVFTNTPTKSPVRGAGRPDAAYAMERMIERVSRDLDLDSADVRARNFVRSDQFPHQPGHKTGQGAFVTYDSGDFHGCLDKVKELADYDNFGRRQSSARREGRYLGIGVSSYIEDTGMGPYEGATVRIQPSGTVLVQTGTASQGQGHSTVFAQVVADQLGVAIDDVTCSSADTAGFPLGVGTVASRTVVAAGTAIYNASVAVREKAVALASMILEADEADLQLANGTVFVSGSPTANVGLGELARRLTPFNTQFVPEGFTPGLEATSFNVTGDAPTASGSHIAEVEVDIDTGAVKIVRYSIAHDCGRMLNPKLVEGQILGGVVHGIGNALFERMHYDELGQPLSVNYGDYLLPLAPEMPHFDVAHQETLSPLNPLGVKGAGEGGTVPAANALIAAVESALKPFGVIVNDYPVDPQRICELLDQSSTVGSPAGEPG